jgi:hypothetical protein
MTHIIFSASDAKEILRYTSLNIISVNELYIEAYATDADIGTFKLNNWYYTTK